MCRFIQNYSKGYTVLERYEIRISGTGGQGIITAGILLGEAVTLYDHRFAVQTQSYGPEARGGASRSDVIISSGPVDYPKVIEPDLVAVVSREAFQKYAHRNKPGAMLIADKECITLNHEALSENAFVLPICETAKTEIGSELATNIVLLGVIAGISGKVSPEALEMAVLARFAKRKPEMNLKAMLVGIAMGQAALSKIQRSANAIA
jgi:2-oxoglutarate ferredoxin oxidoreductase subunit gamma